MHASGLVIYILPFFSSRYLYTFGVCSWGGCGGILSRGFWCFLFKKIFHSIVNVLYFSGEFFTFLSFFLSFAFLYSIDLCCNLDWGTEQALGIWDHNNS